MEDINDWVAKIAGWITLLQGAFKVGKWLLPKIRESFRMWRSSKRKR